MFQDDVFEELVAYLTSMRASFEKYFPEEQNTKMKLNSWIHNPFLPNLQKPQSMSNEIYESLLEMSSDTSMESLFKTTPLNDFWCRISNAWQNGSGYSSPVPNNIFVRNRILHLCSHENKIPL
ncbi:zinc finger BED domain-containing protein 5 [Trichonephila clavipes]|nr:zinc finger BED domain-containing protein 5 [Trichonephila clavipes]